MPIKSFGIHAAIIIVANYFLILFIFPPTVIWYDENLKGRWCPCSKKKSEVESTEVTAISKEIKHGEA